MDLDDELCDHHVEQSKYLENISELNNDDDAVIGENCAHEGEVYGLSKLRRSRRIANCVEKIGQQRWGSNHIAHDVNNRKSDEEDEDIEDEEPVDVDSDEGLEEYDEDELVAAQGQEGISLWDILGEGFLKESSGLGIYMLFWYHF